jgi:SAM-dependent methyltransferase
MGFVIAFLFSYPSIYSTVTCFLRGKKNLQTAIDTYVQPKPGQKIFDVGCGTGDLLRFLPSVEYCGFDMDERYIQYAKKKFGNRGKFFCRKASKDVVKGTELFDAVVVMGVIHHLEDNDAKAITHLAFQVLKPGGRFVMLMDGCYAPEITLIEKFFLFLDRGAYIRTEQCYRNLITDNYSQVNITVRHDMFWIPYSTIVVECVK